MNLEEPITADVARKMALQKTHRGAVDLKFATNYRLRETLDGIQANAARGSHSKPLIDYGEVTDVMIVELVKLGFVVDVFLDDSFTERRITVLWSNKYTRSGVILRDKRTKIERFL